MKMLEVVFTYPHQKEQFLKLHRFEILMFSRLSLGVARLARSTSHAVDDSVPDPKDSGAYPGPRGRSKAENYEEEKAQDE